MTPPPISILATGLICSVGLHARAASAAVRARIANTSESAFIDEKAERISVAEVPIPELGRGRQRLLRMGVAAISECLAGMPTVPDDQIVLLLALPRADRPGTPDPAWFLDALQSPLGLGRRFQPSSTAIAEGRAGAALLVGTAMDLVRHGHVVVLAGVDSWLDAGGMNWLLERKLVLTTTNSDGRIPGEAAAAVALALGAGLGTPRLAIRAVGHGEEAQRRDTGRPPRGDGWTKATKEALAAGGLTMATVGCRQVDCAGDQDGFREAALALSRVQRERTAEAPMLTPMQSLGDIGAATLPALLVLAEDAARIGYAIGSSALLLTGSDDTRRAATLVEAI